MHFDPQHTALVITDAQVDLPSPRASPGTWLASRSRGTKWSSTWWR
jgi:hypothetical protein